MIYHNTAKIIADIVICDNEEEAKRLNEVIKHLKINMINAFLVKEDFIIGKNYIITFKKVEWDNLRYDEEIYRYMRTRDLPVGPPTYTSETHYFLFKGKEFAIRQQLEKYFEEHHPFDLLIEIEVPDE